MAVMIFLSHRQQDSHHGSSFYLKAISGNSKKALRKSMPHIEMVLNFSGGGGWKEKYFLH